MRGFNFEEPYTIRLRIRHWAGRPAHQYRRLWLGPMRAGTECLEFGPDTVHEVEVETAEVHRAVDVAQRGGGLEEVPNDPLDLDGEGESSVTPAGDDEGDSTVTEVEEGDPPAGDDEGDSTVTEVEEGDPLA